MLSPADAALCARDPALPGLAAVLDAGADLAAELGLDGLRTSYVRYKPGTSCVVALTPATGGLEAYTAMAYPPDRYAEVRGRAEWRTGPAQAHFIDRLCTVVAPLVLDRRIKAARALQDPERLLAFLARFGLEDTALTLLRYKPGRRLVLRADDTEGPRALIKSHAAEAFAGAAAGARHAARIAGAPLLKIGNRRRSVVHEWIAGDPLTGASGRVAFRLTGAELARLHRAAPRSGEAAAMPDPRTGAATLAALIPDCAGQAADLAARLERALHKVAGTAPACLIHGDFTADQVLLRDGAPVVIDWDRMQVGDAAQDLGSFLARLDADVIDGTVPPESAEAAGAALLDGYAATAGVVPEAVEVHRSAALFAIAAEGFRSRRPAWDAEARAAIDLVSDRLKGRRAVPREPTPGLSAALDPGRIGSKLGVTGTSPQIALLRHKAGRRALLRYDLAGQPPILGKLRAKGPDRRTPRLHRALRDAGLDGRAPHRVGVPEPLGEIEAPALWLQALVPGRSLGEMLSVSPSQGPLRLAGKALAILHDIDMATDRTWSMTDELEVLQTAFATISDPKLRARAERVRRRAVTAIEALAPVPASGIHRDFYPDQVLIDGNDVWLVDFDLFARGDPLLDVGNFLAHLTELGLRLHGRADGFRRGADAFLSGYEEVRGRCDRRRLAVLEWVSLARHIAISQRIAGREHATEAILAASEQGGDSLSTVIEHPGPRLNVG